MCLSYKVAGEVFNCLTSLNIPDKIRLLKINVCLLNLCVHLKKMETFTWKYQNYFLDFK
jgi:hypothetical protein